MSKIYDLILVDALGLFHRMNGDTHLEVSTKIKKLDDKNPGEFIEIEEKTSGIYGFVRTLAYLRSNFDFINVIIVWDGGNQRRKALYPLYKANRIKEYDTLEEKLEAEKFFTNMKWQTAHLNELLKYFGICQLRTYGEEADDVIAAMCKKNKDLQIGIFSNDKDLQQLICEHVDVVKIDRKKDEKGNWKRETKIIDIETFKEQNEGLKPSDQKYLLMLTGDGADNVPGLRKCGEVTAKQLVKNYGSPRGFLNTLDNKLVKIPRIPIEKQVEFKKKLAEIIDINDKLIQLYPDVKTSVVSTDNDFDRNKAMDLCQYLQFNSFLKEGRLFENLENLRFRE
jgi:5'-3' exonuclease